MKRWSCRCCNLGHQHSKNTHDIRKLSDVPRSFTNQMDWNPKCNCGIQEALYAHKKGIIDLTTENERRFRYFLVHDKVEKAIKNGDKPSDISISV